MILDNASHQGGTWDANNLSSFRKFKVVKDAVNDTYGIVYKDAGGSYLYLQKGSTDMDATVSFTATAFTGFTFTEALTTASDQIGQAIAGLPALRISRSTTGFLHMKVTGGGFALRYFNVIEDANLFVFFNGKSQLQGDITIATNRLTNTVEGEGPGEFPTAARSTLNNAISTAQGVYDNVASTETEMLTAAVTLQAAITEYNNSQNLPFELSEGATEHWHHIVFQRTNANLSLQDNGDDAVLTVETLIVGEAVQLWKFEAGAEDKQYILSSSSGRKIGWNGTRFVAAATGTELRVIKTPNTQYSGWELQRIGSTTMAMNPFGGSTAGNQISEWNVGDGGNPVKFVAIKDFLQTGITNATARLSSTTEGTEFGQFPAAARTDLSDAIISAQDVLDNPLATSTEITNKATAINAAITTYNGQMELSYSKLLSATPNYYRWYKIKNNMYPAKVITANAVVEDGTVICEDAGTSTDAELWRFELNGTGTTVKVMNKSQSTLGIQENGQSAAAKLVVKANASEFVIAPQANYFTLQKLGGGQFNFLHCGGTFNIVGWEASAAASQWSLVFDSETERDITGLELNKDSKYSVYALNGKIHISSVSAEQMNIEVYSLAGQNLYRVSTNNQSVVLDRNFAAGAYIVKINQTITKLMVK